MDESIDKLDLNATDWKPDKFELVLQELKEKYSQIMIKVECLQEHRRRLFIVSLQTLKSWRKLT